MRKREVVQSIKYNQGTSKQKERDGRIWEKRNRVTTD